jgi:uncharacterized membrane protein YeaQ/YmgE (transglycosylase-associated protein family)
VKGVLAALAAFAGGWLLLNLLGALLVGALARRLLPGRDRVGWWTTLLVGFLGGIVGKIVAYLAGWRHLGWLGGFLVSVLGAMALLLVHRLMSLRKAPAGAPPAA